MSSILVKVQPILDETKARKIEDSLVRRFQKVSKTFGGGLRNAMKFGLAGGAIGIAMNALLDPLKEADEKMNSILAKASDITTRARQFGSSSADYLALQTVAKSKGVDEGTLINYLSKIQQKIGEAKQGEDNELREFKDETDIVSAFVQILNSLKNYGKKEGNEKRAYAESQIFGSKLVKGLEALLQTDIHEQVKKFAKGRTKEEYEKEINRLSKLKDTQDELAAKREFTDFPDVSKMITLSSVRSQDAHEKNKNVLANRKLSHYEMYAKIQDTVDKLLLAVSEIATPLVRVITPLVNLISWLADKLPYLTKRIEEFDFGRIFSFFDRVVAKMESICVKLDAVIKSNPILRLLGFKDH